MSLVRDPSQRQMPPASAVELAVADVADLAQILAPARRLFVLTGAGCSTESGIPDYRDAGGNWKRQSPVTYQDFMSSPATRARYWARSLVGWRSIGAADPNAAHAALTRLERAGQVGLLVTQNVDGLHQAAGSRRVVDLHGRLDRVVCMSCHRTTRRTEWQRLLEERNGCWTGLEAPVGPDGDAALEGLDFSRFDVPDCGGCGGVVKPGVVFFGEPVPPWRHAQAAAALATSDAMLVAGSSLMVYSGYRYAVAAARHGTPIVAVNLGRTRADHLLTLKVSAPVGETLPELARMLTG